MANALPLLEQQNPAYRQALAMLRVLLPVLRGRRPPAADELGRFPVAELRRHRLAPLLYWTLAHHGWERHLDPVRLESLRREYVLALKIAAAEEGEIKQVLQVLKQAGLDPVLLKGADLRQRLYPEPALRPMDDLDFLIAPGEIVRTQKLLEGLGYRLSQAAGHPPAGFIEHYGFELAYAPPPGKRLLLEPHWGICAATCQYSLAYEPLYARALPWDYQGLPVKVLWPEHLLIHLCIHAHSDIDFASQILDIILVLEHLPPDWPGLLTEAARCRCTRPVFQLLNTVAFLVPGLTPPAVLAALGAYRPRPDEQLLMGFRGLLRALSRYFPGLHRHRRLWEMATFMVYKLRSRSR